MSDAIGDRKRDLRRRMRRTRRGVADPVQRAAAIWGRVCDEPAVVDADVVMAFRSTAGEPDSTEFLAWCAEHGKTVVTPEPRPDAAMPSAAELEAVDVVIVPGLAFTEAGDRLGQGGGWFDRVLTRLRSGCTTVGVCFAEQIVDRLPVDDHDVAVDIVITDEGRTGR